MISPGCVTSGQWLVHIPSGVKVKLINADGAMCTVRLPDGSWAQYANHDLGYSTETVSDSRGPALDPRGGSNVGTGPVSEKISGTEFAKRALLEGFRRSHPSVVGGIVDNYGTVVNRGDLPVGSVLIHKASGKPVTLIGHSQERNLFVVQDAVGSHGVYSSAELTTGDGSALDAGGMNKSLEKGARLNEGTRVRVTATGRIGVVKTNGHAVSSVVEFDNGSLEAISNSELKVI